MLTKSSYLWNHRGLVLTVFIFSILVSKSPGLFSQAAFIIEDSFDIDGFIGEDIFGNQFFVTGNTINKVSPSTTKVSFNLSELGRVSSIDISDPYNILIFFRDFGRIVFLDQNLVLRTQVDLLQTNLDGIPGNACLSARDGFWVWFPDEFVLVRYNRFLQQEATSDPAFLQSTSYEEVTFMTEKENLLFVSTGKELLVFDLFANLIRIIPGIQTNHFQIMEKHLFYLEGNFLINYNLENHTSTKMQLPENEIALFFVVNNRTIYLQTNVTLKRYHYSIAFY